MKTDEWRDRERDGERRGEQKGPENTCDGCVRGCGVGGSLVRAPHEGCSHAQRARPHTPNHAGAERAKKNNGRQLVGVKQMLRHHDDMEGGAGRAGAVSRLFQVGVRWSCKEQERGGLCTAARGHQLGATHVEVIVFHHHVRKDCQTADNSAHICMFVFLLHW